MTSQSIMLVTFIMLFLIYTSMQLKNIHSYRKSKKHLQKKNVMLSILVAIVALVSWFLLRENQMTISGYIIALGAVGFIPNILTGQKTNILEKTIFMTLPMVPVVMLSTTMHGETWKDTAYGKVSYQKYEEDNKNKLDVMHEAFRRDILSGDVLVQVHQTPSEGMKIRNDVFAKMLMDIGAKIAVQNGAAADDITGQSGILNVWFSERTIFLISNIMRTDERFKNLQMASCALDEEGDILSITLPFAPFYGEMKNRPEMKHVKTFCENHAPGRENPKSTPLKQTEV